MFVPNKNHVYCKNFKFLCVAAKLLNIQHIICSINLEIMFKKIPYKFIFGNHLGSCDLSKLDDCLLFCF